MVELSNQRPDGVINHIELVEKSGIRESNLIRWLIKRGWQPQVSGAATTIRYQYWTPPVRIGE